MVTCACCLDVPKFSRSLFSLKAKWNISRSHTSLDKKCVSWSSFQRLLTQALSRLEFPLLKNPSSPQNKLCFTVSPNLLQPKTDPTSNFTSPEHQVRAASDLTADFTEALGQVEGVRVAEQAVTTTLLNYSFRKYPPTLGNCLFCSFPQTQLLSSPDHSPLLQFPGPSRLPLLEN